MQTAPRDLTTPRDRPTYALDHGRVLELRSPYDLTIEEFERIETLYLQLGGYLITDSSQRTVEEIAARRSVSRDICALATGSEDAYDVLGDVRAMVICNDFMDLCKPIVKRLQTSRVSPEATPSPSQSSSRSSPGSTAARPGRGRRKLR